MPRKAHKPNRRTASPSRSGSRRKNLPEGVSMSDLIRERAHAIYEARGDAPGDAVEDWLRAEREVRAEYEP